MHHVMLDLETLGTRAGCAVLSIGAVQFFPERGELGDEFYTVISQYSSVKRGLHVDPDTVDWWNRQGEQAREVLVQSESPNTSVTIPEALRAFNSYLDSMGSERELRLYGNGADFDNPILSAVYAAAEMKLPGAYGGRCYRTLKSLHELLGPEFAAPKLQRQGTYHNALDDAKSQAIHLMAFLAELRAARGPTHEHYKGGRYKFLGPVRDADTGEAVLGKDGRPRILYEGSGPNSSGHWLRDNSEWAGDVEMRSGDASGTGGVEWVPRFKPIS